MNAATNQEPHARVRAALAAAMDAATPVTSAAATDAAAPTTTVVATRAVVSRPRSAAARPAVIQAITVLRRASVSLWTSIRGP